MNTPAAAAGALLPEETVKLAYELLLGRPVENEKVVAPHQKLGSVAALRRAMIGSAEFQNKMGMSALAPWVAQMGRQTGAVSVEASPKQFELLFKRIRDQWTRLGETEPHWSVLTNDQFKSANFAQHEEAFYKSGQTELALLKAAHTRAGLVINPENTVLELGCGTGRVTHALADIFKHVIAVDVSPANLRICQEKLKQRGKTNVDFVLLKSPKDIQKIPPIDFLYTTKVLQHNPPPVIHYFLTAILGKIRPGGSAFFQVPTNLVNYSFDVATYLASPEPRMEMHCVPMPAVFALFRKNKMHPVEVLMDGMTGMLGSHIFFAVHE